MSDRERKREREREREREKERKELCIDGERTNEPTGRGGLFGAYTLKFMTTPLNDRNLCRT